MIDVLMMNERVINSSCHPAGNLLKNGRKCFQGDGHAPPSIAMTLYFGIGCNLLKDSKKISRERKKLTAGLTYELNNPEGMT
jgi:hypothetical protein